MLRGKQCILMVSQSQGACDRSSKSGWSLTKHLLAKMSSVEDIRFHWDLKQHIQQKV